MFIGKCKTISIKKACKKCSLYYGVSLECYVKTHMQKYNRYYQKEYIEMAKAYIKHNDKFSTDKYCPQTSPGSAVIVFKLLT